MGMTKAAARSRVAHLKKLIAKYRDSRLTLNRELISPEAEDALKKELFDLETQFPDLVTPDSPTQRVGGAPLKEFKKVRHEERMTSFNDAFSEDDMRAWLKRLEDYLGHPLAVAHVTAAHGGAPLFYCELKIDGLAIELSSAARRVVMALSAKILRRIYGRLKRFRCNFDRTNAFRAASLSAAKYF